MQISLRSKFNVGDLVTVRPQRISSEQSHTQALIGQVLSVRIEYRSSSSCMIWYHVELTSSDGLEGAGVIEESVLELYEEERDDNS